MDVAQGIGSHEALIIPVGRRLPHTILRYRCRAELRPHRFRYRLPHGALADAGAVVEGLVQGLMHEAPESLPVLGVEAFFRWGLHARLYCQELSQAAILWPAWYLVQTSFYHSLMYIFITGDPCATCPRPTPSRPSRRRAATAASARPPWSCT